MPEPPTLLPYSQVVPYVPLFSGFRLKQNCRKSKTILFYTQGTTWEVRYRTSYSSSPFHLVSFVFSFQGLGPCLRHFQVGSYRYRSLIEALYTLNSPPVVSFSPEVKDSEW